MSTIVKIYKVMVTLSRILHWVYFIWSTSTFKALNRDLVIQLNFKYTLEIFNADIVDNGNKISERKKM